MKKEEVQKMSRDVKCVVKTSDQLRTNVERVCTKLHTVSVEESTEDRVPSPVESVQVEFRIHTQTQTTVFVICCHN